MATDEAVEQAMQAVGWISRAEATILHEVFRDEPELKHVVEIGSMYGRSAIAIGLALKDKDGALQCIDTFDVGGEGQLKNLSLDGKLEIPPGYTEQLKDESAQRVFRKNIMDHDLDTTVFDWKGRSADYPWGEYKQPVDAVFIDGDHTFEGCTVDLNVWAPRVRVGGLIFCHDYAPNWIEIGMPKGYEGPKVFGARGGVPQAVNMFLKSNPNWYMTGVKETLCVLRRVGSPVSSA